MDQELKNQYPLTSARYAQLRDVCFNSNWRKTCSLLRKKFIQAGNRTEKF